MFKLYEEVGELAQAVLIHRKKSRPEKHLPEEKSKKRACERISRCFGDSCILSHLFGIDLEKAVDKKWTNKEK